MFREILILFLLTSNPKSDTASATDAILNYKPLTFESVTGEVPTSTYQDIKPSEVDGHIHTDHNHAFPK